MNEKTETAADHLPDRLSTDPKSPYYNAEVLSREVGIRFKGIEKTNVEEYCVSEGWCASPQATPGTATATRSPSRCTARSSHIFATGTRLESLRHSGARAGLARAPE